MKSPVEETDRQNPFVFLDVKLGEETVGRVVIELFKNVVPKTVENFRCLCTGEKAFGIQGKPLHYKETVFHKAVPGFMIQGGDIINGDGCGGESIYGLTFKDENFQLKHEFGGEVSMANCGKENTNSSQFYITTVPCPHLDGTNVVFGRVRSGLGVVRDVGMTPTINQKPVLKCMIESCGEISHGEDWGVIKRDETEDIYPPYPEDLDICDSSLQENDLKTIICRIKESGNKYFKEQKYIIANCKYKKALRYIEWYQRQVTKDNTSKAGFSLNDLKLRCLLNSAAVNLKDSNFKSVVALCNEALAMDCQNIKALFRRAQANKGLNNHELALRDLKCVLFAQPYNKKIKAEIKSSEKLLKEYSVLEKERCVKMLDI